MTRSHSPATPAACLVGSCARSGRARRTQVRTALPPRSTRRHARQPPTWYPDCCLTAPLLAGERLDAPGHLLARRRRPADEEDGIIPGDRAEQIGPRLRIEGVGDRLG